jgi:hypothetical protein
MRKGILFLILVFMFTCTCNVFAAEQEELLWPFELDLKSKVWVTVGGQSSDVVGAVKIWNTESRLKILVTPASEFKIDKVHIHVVTDADAELPLVLNKKGKPVPARFDRVTDYRDPADEHMEEFYLGADLDVCWGVSENSGCSSTRYIVVHAQLVQLVLGDWVPVTEEGAFAMGDHTFESFAAGEATGAAIDWGWYATYPVAKVQPGHFIDAPVLGLTYQTPTQFGTTNESGEFFYIPKERVEISVGNLPLGSALADKRISPVDLFAVSELVDDPNVINIARLLQSLDKDGNAQDGPIRITEEVRGCLDSALGVLGLTEVDFANDAEVEAVINQTVSQCSSLEIPVPLVAVSKDQAAENLNQGQKAGNLVKKNVSKTPAMASDKAKMDIMPVYVPAKKADGTDATVVYYNEDGTVKETRTKAKPIVITYLDEVEDTGASDVFVAISRDDGDTWKRRNISRTADKSSFTLLTGDEYPGDSAKPMLHAKSGNKIFVAWTDKYCRGGRPGYAIEVCQDTNGDQIPDPCDVCRDTDEGVKCETDYPGDDAYWEDDIFGVAGPQRSVTYDPLEYPDMGEVPYSCVWAARGVIDPATGDITWFKPERLTSGRRDANQLFAASGNGAGFALSWQEDPDGLRPGSGYGPGDGWGGATTNHKTDIWYSFIKWADFGTIDEAYVPPENDTEDAILDDIVDTDPELAGREKALVPMSLPVRISDNDTCNTENMQPEPPEGDGDGTHRYCSEVSGLCVETVEMVNENDEIKHVCKTADGRLLDGNTGASRPNLFLQPYTKADGTKSAWAILGYEETKGLGAGPPVYDEYGNEIPQDVEDEGKNVIYHSFDFTEPNSVPEAAAVSGGGIVNLPQRDAAGNLVIGENGEYLYENARRPRFVSQPKAKKGASGTVLLALYRQGQEGKGRPADIFVRRMVAPSTGNPYAFDNFVCEQSDANGLCLKGAQNISSVTPTETWTNPETGVEKVTRWAWTPANLDDESFKNSYSNARAHRGSMRGDTVIIGYDLTQSWAASATANDKEDLYIRRSFNGGQDWTTNPSSTGPTVHNVVYVDPVTREETVTPTEYVPGAPEPPRNVTNLRNNRFSVLEPRIVPTPGTIKKSDGTSTGFSEDIQDTSKYQVAYGLELNQAVVPGAEIPRVPIDIHYSRTSDKGQNYDTVIVTPGDGSGKPEEGWKLLAKDQPEQSAAQIRTTPDGSRLYSIWLEEGEKGSDIMFRRVDYPEPTQ